MRGSCKGLGEDGRRWKALTEAGDGRAQTLISRWAPRGVEGEGGSQEVQEQPGFVMEPQPEPELRVSQDPLCGALSRGRAQRSTRGDRRGRVRGPPQPTAHPCGGRARPSARRSLWVRTQRKTPPCSSPGTTGGDAPACRPGAVPAIQARCSSPACNLSGTSPSRCSSPQCNPQLCGAKGGGGGRKSPVRLQLPPQALP